MNSVLYTYNTYNSFRHIEITNVNYSYMYVPATLLFATIAIATILIVVRWPIKDNHIKSSAHNADNTYAGICFLVFGCYLVAANRCTTDTVRFVGVFLHGTWRTGRG